MSEFRLRPHHGLCIAFFEGKGYSPEFIRHMAAVKQTLREESCVQLTAGEDIICAVCPNNKADICIHDEKVKRYDEAVLAACRLKAGQLLSWRDFCSRIQTEIIRADKLHSVCGDCGWGAICRSKADIFAKNGGLP